MSKNELTIKLNILDTCIYFQLGKNHCQTTIIYTEPYRGRPGQLHKKQLTTCAVWYERKDMYSEASLPTTVPVDQLAQN
ncbi:hypothetical protein BpHYR1_016619 [Brachionus plicatilis]|uniref:Uncharacterized protein n=1 Tax=Brachionus plicatilis TaxID=10195 RepID=A0A3M7SL79_BRAPC|nr:hypothetical protein BpHYR1_016619 [Brachionus plicatilis]